MANNNSPMNRASESSGMSKGAIVAIIIGVLLIVVLIGVIIGLAVGKSNNANNDAAPDESGNRSVIVNDQNVAGVIRDMQENPVTPPGMYEVTMNTTWNFPNGSAPSSNSYVANAVSNTNSVYFDVLLGEAEEVVYKSPILPVGSDLRDITLDKKLEAGNYDAVVKYTLIDEDGKDISTVRMAITIVVEN